MSITLAASTQGRTHTYTHSTACLLLSKQQFLLTCMTSHQPLLARQAFSDCPDCDAKGFSHDILAVFSLNLTAARLWALWKWGYDFCFTEYFTLCVWHIIAFWKFGWDGWKDGKKDGWKDRRMDREMEGRKKERGRKRKEERKGGTGEGNKTQLVTLEKKSMEY